MNLTWHIIWKDLRRLAWPLVFWGVTGLHLLASLRWNVQYLSIGDSAMIISLLIHLTLIFVLPAWIVQEDGLVGDTVFWRTRPIHSRRLLVAKLCLIVVLFAVLPIIILLVGKALSVGIFFRRFDALHYVFLTLLCVSLSSAAIASCTKELAHYLMVGVTSLTMVVLLSNWMRHHAFPNGIPTQNIILISSKFVAAELLCGIMGLAVLINQYCLRRFAVSVGLLITTVVGLVLVLTLWNWRFL